MNKTIHRPGLLNSTPAPVKKHRPPLAPKVVWSKPRDSVLRTASTGVLSQTVAPTTRQVNQQRMKGLLG